jgi:hypothetical protein
MATETVTINSATEGTEPSEQYPREPLQLKGVLDQYESFDVTPTIGREFKDVNLKEWLRAPNSDELIRDLAITSKSWYQSASYDQYTKRFQSPSAV